MKTARSFFAFLAIAVSCAGARAGPPEHHTGIAIVGADVLPMTRRDKLSKQTVLVVGDRITQVGSRASVRVPQGYRVIDGTGQTLLPGLVDMHVHLANELGRPGDAAQRALAVMLAHGVTTVRGMAGAAAHPELREAIERGEVIGPRLYAASPALNVNSAGDMATARSLVRAAKQAQFDLIKSHHLDDPAIWSAVQDEARVQGLGTAGHVTNEVGLERAVTAGQQIEHLDGAVHALLPEAAPERAMPFGQVPPPPVLQAAAAVGDHHLQALARRLAAARSYQVPTLALFEKIADVERSPEQAAAHPAMRYVPEAALKAWAQQLGQLKQAGFTQSDGAMLTDLRRRIVRAYAAAGVPIMAGSDTAQAFHVWGPGLIDEIEALGRAGLTPDQALRAATVVPRDYLRSLPNSGSAKGRRADFGTVEVGARADLILVAGDPSRDLAALRSLKTVIAAGRVFDRAALDLMLDRAAKDAKSLVSTGADKRVFVMRHLPAGTGSDPALTTEGAGRAARLAEQLKAAGVTSIYVTDTRRATETARPLAAALGIAPDRYDARDPGKLVDSVRAKPGNTLVVGHSNTVPDLIARLGGIAPPALAHDSFGDLWLIEPNGSTRRLKVGEAAPPMRAACATPGLAPGAMCGVIDVPEDRANPAGRRLPIHFAVIPATGRSTEPPLVMLPGGPGLGGVQSGAGIEQLFAGVRANRDILLIDQRGTGRSNGLPCASSEDPAEALLRLSGTPAAAVIACRDALSQKADLRFYHTREAVLDMEAVRAALGYERLALFGMSYGTRIALDYLRLFPDHVSHTVIRAAAPPSMKLPLWTPRDTQVSFETLVRYCREQPDCAARHPDLAGDLKRILARLEAAPQPIQITDPRSGRKISAALDRAAFGAVMFILLYIPEFYVQLPPLLDRGAAGDLSPLVQTAAPALLGVSDAIAWGLRWSVICDEDVRRIDRAQIARATRGTFMGASAVQEDVAACALWPKATVPADYLQPVRSDKPVLIISGAMDPVAGRFWGDEISRTLSNSIHLTVDGASHLPPLPGCTGNLMAKFLAGTQPRALDTACVGQAIRPRLRVAGTAGQGR